MSILRVDDEELNCVLERTYKVASAAESDLTIHCKGSVFHVHRSLLSLASPAWNRMLNGDFAESTSSTIVFEEDCPRALSYVLDILYGPVDLGFADSVT